MILFILQLHLPFCCTTMQWIRKGGPNPQTLFKLTSFPHFRSIPLPPPPTLLTYYLPPNTSQVHYPPAVQEPTPCTLLKSTNHWWHHCWKKKWYLATIYSVLEKKTVSLLFIAGSEKKVTSISLLITEPWKTTKNISLLLLYLTEKKSGLCGSIRSAKK
jgi:hypothetical protein